jgi:hypothetical protein
MIYIQVVLLMGNLIHVILSVKKCKRFLIRLPGKSFQAFCHKIVAVAFARDGTSGLQLRSWLRVFGCPIVIAAAFWSPLYTGAAAKSAFRHIEAGCTRIIQEDCIGG